MATTIFMKDEQIKEGYVNVYVGGFGHYTVGFPNSSKEIANSVLENGRWPGDKGAYRINVRPHARILPAV